MRRGDVVAVAGLLALLTASAMLAPRAARLLPREAAPPHGEGGEAPAPPAAAEPAPAEVRISVKLYFEDAEEPVLTVEDREIAYSGELSEQVRTVVEELIKGSARGHLAPLPGDTRVLGVFVAARGTAFLDLSKEAATGGTGGTAGERLAVYAIVDTITANFPAIRRVQLLVDDRPLETLRGHLDLSRPLPPDMTLVGAAPVVEPDAALGGATDAASAPPPTGDSAAGLGAAPPSPTVRPSGGSPGQEPPWR